MSLGGGEANFWGKTVRPAFAPYGHLERVENEINVGTPDVNYALRLNRAQIVATEGWIELKHALRWPSRPGTLMRFEHYSVPQRNWAQRRTEAGGRVHLLCQIDTTYLLFDAATATTLVFEGGTRAQLEAGALVVCDDTFLVAPMLRWLLA